MDHHLLIAALGAPAGAGQDEKFQLWGAVVVKKVAEAERLDIRLPLLGLQVESLGEGAKKAKKLEAEPRPEEAQEAQEVLVEKVA